MEPTLGQEVSLSGYDVFDYAVRAAAIYQWGLLGYEILRISPRSTRTWVLASFVLAVIGYLAAPLCLFLHAPEILSHLVYVLLFASPPLLWLSGRAILDDDFALRAQDFGIVVAAEVIDLATYRRSFLSRPYFHLVENWGPFGTILKALFPQILTYVFILLAIREAYLGQRQDLIEDRASFRRKFIIVMSVLGFLIASADIASKFEPALAHPEWTFFAFAVLICGVTLFRRLLINGPDLFFLPVQVQKKVQPPLLGPDLIAKLTRLIEQEKVYLRPTLDVVELARELGAPDYRLRRYINQELGFRNFNQFLNHYRVREAKQILASEQGRTMPIYNLALELGYGSVLSFQRAFKTATGTAPSEFKLTRSSNEMDR